MYPEIRVYPRMHPVFIMDKLQAIFWTGDIDNHYLGHQFEEIFKSRIYAPYLENIKDAVVLDIGANVGIFSLYASKYAKRVYALEPSLEHYTTLTQMLSFNKITNVIPLKKAIYIKSGQFPFHHNKNRTMYSLHQSVEDNSQKPEQVSTTTLDELIDVQKIDHINLMKIDVEGSEFEILGGEGFRKIASKVDVVIGESHVWANRHVNQLRESLKNNGFSVTGIPNDAQLFVATKERKT